MSRLDDKLYYFAKITIEAETPLVLASGKNGSLFDIELVRDANRLPAIPGTTITGILRHSVMKYDKELSDKIFGNIKEDAERNVSAFECSWGYIHDSKNHCVKDCLSKADIQKDSILNELYKNNNSAFKRDHTRIDQKGVAKDSGKFDRSFVPVGTRFSFTIGMWAQKENSDWKKILEILCSPFFRLGGAGHDGYGKVKIVEIKIPSRGFYDISKEEDILFFKDESKLIDDTNKYESNVSVEEIQLAFPLGFRIGGGIKQFSTGIEADIHPCSEVIIEWNGNNGKFSDLPKITIPGSAVKGALRHRAAFHLARKQKQWIGKNSSAEDGLSYLFGDAETKNSDSTGRAGKLWFTDLKLDTKETYIQTRNSINRFTGGTLNTALFQEENVGYQQIFKMNIYFDSDINKDSEEFTAFKWALEDLKKGRLAIGGGSGHGLGFNQVEGE